MAVLWASQHAPSSEPQLVVTKKRIADVKDFLTGQLGPSRRVLVLRGPPGCGKASVLRALCNDYGFEVAEWDPVARGALRGGESVGDAFFRFLSQADRYCTLCSTNGSAGSALASVPKPRVALVRDFPFTLLDNIPGDPARAANFLERFQGLVRQGQLRRAVFCFNDSYDDFRVVNRLFLQSDAEAVATINFDSVAKTFVQKALVEVLRAEGIDPAALDTASLSVDCNGDLRHALNALQLAAAGLPRNTGPAASNGTSVRGRGRGRGAGRGRAAAGAGDGTAGATAAVELGLRPASMDLFHALGRLLYCKRPPPEGFAESAPKRSRKAAAPAEPKQLPHHLLVPKASRPPLYFVPEVVVNATNKEPSTIVDWVFTNAPRFCGDVEDLAAFGQHLAEVDAWGAAADWRGRGGDGVNVPFAELAASVQVRSFLDSNLHPTPPSFADPCVAKVDAELGAAASFNMARPLMADVSRHRLRRLDELAVLLERAGPHALGGRSPSGPMIRQTLPFVHLMLWTSRGQHPMLRRLPNALMTLMMELSADIDSGVLRRGAGEGLQRGGGSGGDAGDDQAGVPEDWSTALDEDPIEA